MISCQTARRRILGAHDGELDLEQDLAVQAHVADCEACLRLWRRALALAQALTDLPPPPVASLDLEQTVARVRARCERADGLPAPAPRSRRVAAAGLVAASLVAATLVATRLAAPGHRPDPQLDPRLPSLAQEPGATVATQEAERDRDAGGVALQDEPRSTGALEVERVEASRRQVRAALVTALETDPLRDGVESFARAVDRGLEPLARQGWPVTRLVERCVDDPDLALAGAAARYLGRRGDRLSARALARRLTEPGSPALREALVLALEDAGEDGLAALGPAAREPALAADVLRIARTVGGELAVGRALEVVAALDGLRGGEGELRQALGVLASLGQPGVEALIGLGAGGEVPGGSVLELLAEVRGARAALLQHVDTGPEPEQVDFLLAALGRLEASEALDWVEARCRDRLHRTAAATCLAELGSFEALASAFELRDAGLLPEGGVEAGLERLAARRPGALPAHVLCLEERGDRGGLDAMLAVLLEVEAPWAGAGLAALARSSRLDQDQRVWAALAVGEVGAVDELTGLVDLLQALEPGSERLAAACLLSIHALGGRVPVLDALAARGAPPAEVLELLDERGERAPGRNLAASLYKLARRIEPWLDPENHNSRRMTP